MLQNIQKAIQEAQMKGYKVGEHFNALIIPSNLLDEFEKESNTLLAKETQDSRKMVFGLEVLVCGKNEQVRFGKIF